MTAFQHADEDDGMPHRLPILRVKTHQIPQIFVARGEL
jgi:hypothetical protein